MTRISLTREIARKILGREYQYSALWVRKGNLPTSWKGYTGKRDTGFYRASVMEMTEINEELINKLKETNPLITVQLKHYYQNKMTEHCPVYLVKGAKDNDL